MTTHPLSLRSKQRRRRVATRVVKTSKRWNRRWDMIRCENDGSSYGIQGALRVRSVFFSKHLIIGAPSSDGITWWAWETASYVLEQCTSYQSTKACVAVTCIRCGRVDWLLAQPHWYRHGERWIFLTGTSSIIEVFSRVLDGNLYQLCWGPL